MPIDYTVIQDVDHTMSDATVKTNVQALIAKAVNAKDQIARLRNSIQAVRDKVNTEGVLTGSQEFADDITGSKTIMMDAQIAECQNIESDLEEFANIWSE